MKLVRPLSVAFALALIAVGAPSWAAQHDPHGGWWIFWMLVIGAALFYGWQRSGRRDDGTAEKLQEKPHEVLRRRLASGAITPQRYEEHKALLDPTTETRFAC